MPEKEFLKAYKAHPRLRTKINNFQRQTSSTNISEDEFVAIRPEWTTVDRILACRSYHFIIYIHFVVRVGLNSVI